MLISAKSPKPTKKYPKKCFLWHIDRRPGLLFLEFFLGISIFLPPKFRLVLLSLGITFHLGIAITMGLVSFAFAMWAALLLSLWPSGNLIGLITALIRLRLNKRLAARPNFVLASDEPGR
ncbi:hypothetical protein E3T39_12770 [Cryobacterium suzukii]|uniref:Uncharacterized protein n=1 Tax=Cryobacterium suzukii TaxID=1259198 RepID=A0A4V6QID4_9MICO|nr:hypothetical protein [Cryobacterium suzukii]TFD57658.1 hypothetical protein E3T39_12770 [Cryobacterium suzukii]